MILNSKILYM